MFTVVLYAETKTLFSGDPLTDGSTGLGLNESDYLDGTSDGNASALFAELDVITDTKNEILSEANKAPGGADSTAPEDSSTTEGTMQKSGLGLVTSAGKFLYSIPKVLILSVSSFLGIRPQFATVASAIIILIVAIILVSSILRNRLWGKMKNV